MAACGGAADHGADDPAHRCSGGCVIVIMVAVIAMMPTASGDATNRSARQAADQRARCRVPAMMVVMMAVIGVMRIAIGPVAVAPIAVGRIAVCVGRVAVIAIGRVGVDIDRIGHPIGGIGITVVARMIDLIAVSVIRICGVAVPAMVITVPMVVEGIGGGRKRDQCCSRERANEVSSFASGQATAKPSEAWSGT